MSWAWLGQLLFDSTISWLWPIAVLPALSALLCNRAADLLPPTRADWRVAAALAGAPGLIMLILLAMAVGRGVLHFHLDGIQHLIKYHLVWLLAWPILLPAIMKARARGRRLSELTARSIPPGTRLAAAAADVGIEARELPLRTSECFVAGVRRPIAYLSTAAVARVSDAELRAALHHERAHRDGADPALYAILSFLADVVPTGDRAMQACREARERRADTEAALHAGPLPLASALLAFSRPRQAGLVGMADADPAWRLRAILAVEAEGRPAPIPARVIAALIVSGAMAAWPAVQVPLAFLLCDYRVA